MRKIFLFLLLIITAAQISAQNLKPEIKHPQGNFIIIKGAKIWYEIEGAGEPVLLIPGGPGNSHTYFHPWFSDLAKNFKVIYYDAFGRGKSDRAKDSTQYTFSRDVEDVELLRKSLGFEKWIVVGHSYGGMVAQAYALKYPGSIEKLVLSNTLYDAEMWQANNDNSNYELRNQYPEVWEKLIKLREAGFHSSSIEHQKAYEIPSGLLYYYDPSNADKATTDSLIINPTVYYTLVGDDGDFIIGGDVAKLDFRTKLKDIKIPMLIIEGRYDRVALPRFSIKFKDYAPQAEFVMFEKSGHNPYLEEREKYFNLLNEFLLTGK
ncbi:MAG TPA: proline iminopeptidase-family hydrolase [Ignavibacteriaceae bacterium]|nr:proline iminopeptidase-family hydrolase [Ignavibacteriaceae bacterium]